MSFSFGEQRLCRIVVDIHDEGPRPRHVGCLDYRFGMESPRNDSIHHNPTDLRSAQHEHRLEATRKLFQIQA